MVKWREELLNIDEETINIAEKEIQKFNDAYFLSEHGRQKVGELIKKFSLVNVLEAIDIAYPKYDATKTSESWNVAFDKIGGICFNRQQEKKNPNYALHNKAYYAFKRNFNVFNETKVRNAIRSFVHDEDSFYRMLEIVESSKNYSTFFKTIESLSGDYE